MTHQQRVALYVRIINTKLTQGLNTNAVAYLRRAAPSQIELRALNDALRQLGWNQ